MRERPAGNSSGERGSPTGDMGSASGDPDTERCLPSRYPFQSLDNVIMTPHASGWSGGLLERRWRVMIDNFNRLSRGEPLLNMVHAPG